MNNVRNVIIAGVGGQGSLLASRVLGALYMAQGLDVKVSEVHGMSQRGGSVITYVRAGEKVVSPLVPQGEADLVIAFENIEALRYAGFLKKGGLAVVNSQRISPMPVLTGAAEYPEGASEKLSHLGAKVVELDALGLAEKAGSAKAVNIVMLGVVSNFMEYSYEDWKKVLENTVPAKFLEMNLKAFDLGREAAKIGG